WRWRLGSAANLAALLVAVDPLLVHESTQVMTETVAALLAAAAMLAVTSAMERPGTWRAVASGVAIGLSVLCRPTFLVWGGCLAVLVGWGANRVVRARLRVLYLAGMAVVLAPWAIRNEIELGRPVITTTHGGYTLLLGNNAYFYKFL